MHKWYRPELQTVFPPLSFPQSAIAPVRASCSVGEAVPWSFHLKSSTSEARRRDCACGKSAPIDVPPCLTSLRGSAGHHSKLQYRRIRAQPQSDYICMPMETILIPTQLIDMQTCTS